MRYEYSCGCWKITTPDAGGIGMTCKKHLKQKDKLKGQRLGQVVYNALWANQSKGDFRDSATKPYDIIETLFFIPDSDLTKLINDYLRSLE